MLNYLKEKWYRWLVLFVPLGVSLFLIGRAFFVEDWLLSAIMGVLFLIPCYFLTIHQYLLTLKNYRYFTVLDTVENNLKFISPSIVYMCKHDEKTSINSLGIIWWNTQFTVNLLRNK